MIYFFANYKVLFREWHLSMSNMTLGSKFIKQFNWFNCVCSLISSDSLGVWSDLLAWTKKACSVFKKTNPHVIRVKCRSTNKYENKLKNSLICTTLRYLRAGRLSKLLVFVCSCLPSSVCINCATTTLRSIELRTFRLHCVHDISRSLSQSIYIYPFNWWCVAQRSSNKIDNKCPLAINVSVTNINRW